MVIVLISLLFFTAIVLGSYVIVGRARAKGETQETLRQRLGAQDDAEKKTRAPVMKDLRLSSIESFNELLGRFNAVRKVSSLVDRAGIKRRVGEVVLAMGLLFIVGAAVGGSIFKSVPIAVCAGAGAGFIPITLLSRRAAKRQAKFSEQLPDALDLMKAALQAGHSLPTALRVVADEFTPPIAEEFERVADEMRLGLPLRDSLRGLNQRITDENLPVMTVGILVVNESGGNLAEVLENVAHTVRERFRLLREVETMTAQGKLSGIMLTSLPVVVGLVMMAIIPGYFDPMLYTSTGRLMLAYSVGSIILGHLVIQRIVKIRV